MHGRNGLEEEQVQILILNYKYWDAGKKYFMHKWVILWISSPLTLNIRTISTLKVEYKETSKGG